MTSETAGDILDVTPGSAARMAREGIIRRKLKHDENGHAYYDLNGQDVQRVRTLRDVHGVTEGMRLARERAKAGNR